MSLHGYNFPIKESFNKLLKVMKFLKDFRFKLKEVIPCELVIIINKANIEFLSINGVTSRTPDIRVN